MKLQPSIRFILLSLSAAALMPGVALAQLSPSVNPLANNPMATSAAPPSVMGPGGQPLIYGDKMPERGWDGLAKVLEAISPSVDTRIPLTASEITRRIDSLLSAGRDTQALEEIEKRLAVEADRKTPGTDVQLMFMHARTLVVLNRIPEAQAIYQQMTQRFPELPEPWNNLAALYAQRGDLDQARRALDMALMIYPDYAMAQANLGDVQLKLALRAYEKASALGAPGMRARIVSVQAVLDAESTVPTQTVRSGGAPGSRPTGPGAGPASQRPASQSN